MGCTTWAGVEQSVGGTAAVASVVATGTARAGSSFNVPPPSCSTLNFLAFILCPHADHTLSTLMNSTSPKGLLDPGFGHSTSLTSLYCALYVSTVCPHTTSPGFPHG